MHCVKYLPFLSLTVPRGRRVSYMLHQQALFLSQIFCSREHLGLSSHVLEKGLIILLAYNVWTKKTHYMTPDVYNVLIVSSRV